MTRFCRWQGCAAVVLLSMASPAALLAATPQTVRQEAAWPRSAPPADPTIEARVESVLVRMSLEAKVGQTIQADILNVTPEEVRKYHLGSILNGGNSGPGDDDKAPAAEWLKLADRFYDASMAGAGAEPAIPIIWGTDGVRGNSNIPGATLFPHNIGLGAAHDPDLVRRIGEITAKEIVVTGQDWTFAPALSVVRDDRWGRTYEGYSEDPEIVRAYVGPMVEGLQGRIGTGRFLGPGRVIATAKHFVGDGGTDGGRNTGDNLSDPVTLRDVDGAGYPVAIGAGVQSVMASFSSVSGQKMHGYKPLLTGALRDQMGFDGLVVGDWNGHGEVSGCTTENCAASLNAGLDMFMAPNSWRGLYANTLAQVRDGRIPMARLDDAVRHILRVKVRAGMFEKGRPSARPFGGQFNLLGAPEHRAVAREAVRKSLVLLKNNDRLLPLRRNARVLVAGDGADSIAKQSGGWAITWQGTGTTNADFPHAQSIFAGIREAVAGSGSAILSADGRFGEKPDVAIVVFGENPYAEGAGDIRTLEYSPLSKKDLELLRQFKKAGIPVVSVFLSGRPLWVNPELNASDAFVAAFLPGGEGGGVADVLFRRPDGKVNHDFTGRLSFSWPKRTDQFALNRGGRDYDPLFAYGYGLTYARSRNLGPLSEFKPKQSVEDALEIFGRRGFNGGVMLAEDRSGGGLTGNSGQSVTGRLRVTAVDRAAQEDARTISWDGTGNATFAVTSTPLGDLSTPERRKLALVVDYRVDAPPTSAVVLRMACGQSCGAAIPITDVLSAAPRGEWRQLAIPLECLASRGLDLSKVAAPFVLQTVGKLRLTISRVRIADGVGGVCPA